MKHLVLAAFALFMAAPAAIAAETNTAWHDVPIRGGCVVVLAVGSNLPTGEVSWNGECTPQQPINGPGILRIDLTPGAYAGAVMLLETTFVAGVPHGEMSFTVLDENGAQISVSSAPFNMGCLVRENGPPCDPYVPPAAN